MLLWLLDQLGHGELPSGMVGLEKITFRAALAALASFLLAVVVGPLWIGWLRRRFREPIRGASEAINRLHAAKDATPTMGGLFVVAALAAAMLLLGRMDSPAMVAAMIVLLGMGLLGAIDDLIKLRTRRRGMTARSKLAGQMIVAGLAAIVLFEHHATTADGLLMHVPLLGQFSLTTLTQGSAGAAGWVFMPLAVLVIVGSSNAVNLTDGLDGLAGGCLIFTIAAMTGIAYASGHAELAAYLGLPRIPGAGELAILGGAAIGAVLGFLWFNCHPAQVFLGDTGALPLGGLIGLLAVATRQELLLLLVGGVFVAEALSVIVQVISYKLRRRRVFLCAPLHHHFQLLGWPEGKVVVRFWIAAALCAVVGLATLKVHVNEQAPASTGPIVDGRPAESPASATAGGRNQSTPELSARGETSPEVIR